MSAARRLARQPAPRARRAARSVRPERRARLAFALAAGALLPCLALLPRVSSGTSDRAAATAEPNVRIAFTPGILNGLSPADARAAVIAWSQQVLGSGRYAASADGRILAANEDLTALLQRREVDAVVLRTAEYAKIPRGLLDADTVWVNERHGRVQEQYVLLVRSDSRVRELSALRGASVLVWGHARSSLARPWLAAQLRERRLGTPETFFGGLVEKEKLTAAVLPVFFRQSDACIVPLSGFEDLRELNPQVGEQLRIVAVSPEVVPSFLVFRGAFRSHSRRGVEAAILELPRSAEGRQLLTVFGCERIVPVPTSALQSTFDVLGAPRPQPHDRPAMRAQAGEEAAE